jgi:hypothetical protein
MEVVKKKYKIKLMAKREVQFFEWSKRECKFFMAKRDFRQKEPRTLRSVIAVTKKQLVRTIPRSEM